MRLKHVVSCFAGAVINIERSLLYIARMEQKGFQAPSCVRKGRKSSRLPPAGDFGSVRDSVQSTANRSHHCFQFGVNVAKFQVISEITIARN